MASKKEAFLSDIKWLTDLTVRASYGTSGNSSVGNYDALATTGNNTSSAYNTATGYFANTAGNPLLSWETAGQANFNIQARLFNKLNVEVEYFNKLTKDMYINVPYPYTSGFQVY